MEDTLHTGHTYNFNVNGDTLTILDKSYAGCFRKFWDYFMNYDLDRTVRTIEKAGIRTSDSEYFVSKNGSKKKNIQLIDDRWVYTHLNPGAMERAYNKFISEWNKEPTAKEAALNGDVTERKFGLKNIYKKSLAMNLIRNGHDIEHTMRNRNNPKYQVFVFVDTPKLRRDIAMLNEQEYVGRLNESGNINK
ncbi:UNVERIFIED_CONTAM: hypothetical protein N8J90_14970 [Halobacillus marinus]|uniref:hypothetical protein n=1 Tax=Bacillaceae TaxID=186817 RepID=UPI0002A51C3A|nr:MULTISPECIES: hypothetical protein [Bacillaceae]ELK48491.1 hypothetical protein D479_02697 [Halobacillus sp. BAB-2008]